jgi:transcription elongation factor
MFKINPSIEAMRTGPVPWLGLMVDFVKGEYKGQHGAIRDVNRYYYDSTKMKGRSGIMLTVERYVFTMNSSNTLVKVDYDAVRYHR